MQIRKRCKFNKDIVCGYLEDYCPKCKKIKLTGQKLLFQQIDKKTEEEDKQKMINPNMIVCCAYCLHEDKLIEFGYGGKYKLLKCPDCGCRQRLDTLTMNLSVEEYAKWVFENRAFARIKFDKFKQRLKEKGIDKEFWNAYKRLKTSSLLQTSVPEEEILTEQEYLSERRKRMDNLADAYQSGYL